MRLRSLLTGAFAVSLACGGVTPAPPVEPEPPAEVEDFAPVAPVRPVFPLAVGDRWTWQVTRHVGAGLRVLFIPTTPARDDVVATWVLTVDRALPDGRYAATLTRTAPEQLPATTALTLWTQADALWMLGPDGPQPALELVVPPDAVATERVACVAHYLDHLPGTCSPAPGGPLSVPPGPVSGVVSQDADNGRTLAQVLVGIGTAGLLIPGNRAATELAELTDYTTSTPPTQSAPVEAFRRDPTPAAVEKGLRAPVDREDVAAFVALAAPADRVEVARRSLPSLPAGDRPSIARVVLSVEPDPAARLRALAALVPGLGTPGEARRESVVALVPAEDQVAARALLEGRWPVLRATLAAPEGDLAAMKQAAAVSPPDREEALVVLANVGDTNGALDVLLPLAARGDQLPLLTAACAQQAFDEERLPLLISRGALLAAHEADLEGLAALLGTFAFDAGEAAGATVVLRAASPAARPPLLRVALVGMDFDEERLMLLKAWPVEAKAMGPADRRATLDAFDTERAAAEALLR
jgi:hypothetical protein